jgi:two-component system LytT family sensor kinase
MGMDSLLPHERLRGRGPIVLACLIWVLHALIEMATVGRFFPLAVIWAAHGLVLMVIMTALLDRAWSIPGRSLRLITIVALPVIFTLIQSVLDLWSAQYLSGVGLRASIAAAIDALRGNVILHEAPSVGGMQFSVNLKHNFKIYIWLFGFYAVSIGLLRAARSSYEARLEAQEARLDALRLQIAPHFLFNALNALSALVSTGRHSDAEVMIGRLSDFYRSSLLTTNGELAPLEQELDAIHDYLEIERVRFGDRLQVSFDIAGDLGDVRVPRLILQPLVENAMKHGVARTGAQIQIRVTAHTDGRRLFLGVANDLPADEADEAPPGTGSGLANIHRRLAALYGPAADLTTSRTDSQWIAIVALPWRAENVSRAGSSGA